MRKLSDKQVNEFYDPNTAAQKLLQKIPRRYRFIAVRFTDIRVKQSFNSGYNDGMARQKEEQKKSKEQLRVDISISIQQVASSNAQIATCLARVMDNLYK